MKFPNSLVLGGGAGTIMAAQWRREYRVGSIAMWRIFGQPSSCVRSAEDGPSDPTRFSLRRAALAGGGIAYLVTGLLVGLGVLWGIHAGRGPDHPFYDRLVPPCENKYLDAISSWDGQWYLKIVIEGYSFDLGGLSSAAFFPLYPWLAGQLVDLTGMEPELALLIVAHFFLFASFVLLFLYVRERYPEAPPGVAFCAVWAFGLFPTTFFARVAYSESTFIFLSILALYGMKRNWPLPVVAAIVGLSTAARSVGVALILPLAMDVWQKSGSFRQAAGKLAWSMPLAVWGLAAHTAYLGLTLGEPLAMVKAQRNWNWNWNWPVTPLEHLWILATLEPLWSTYVPSAPAYWKSIGHEPSAFCSLQFANPIFLVLGAALVTVGVWKRWLSRYEAVLAAGLLAIPYVLRSHEMFMQSQGRFVGAVFPIYLVLGNLLARSPLPVAVAALGISACFLAIYSAMFAAGYLFI